MTKTRNRLVMEAMRDGSAKSIKELCEICNLDRHGCEQSVSSLKQHKDLIGLPKVSGTPKHYRLTEKGINRLQEPDRPFGWTRGNEPEDIRAKKDMRNANQRKYRSTHKDKVRQWKKNEKIKDKPLREPAKSTDQEIEDWIAGKNLPNPETLVQSAMKKRCALSMAWTSLGN